MIKRYWTLWQHAPEEFKSYGYDFSRFKKWFIFALIGIWSMISFYFIYYSLRIFGFYLVDFLTAIVAGLILSAVSIPIIIAFSSKTGRATRLPFDDQEKK